MGFQTKSIVIDGRGHLLGRLASIVAKSLLQGQKVTVVRCEGINVSGNLYRNKMKYQDFLAKRMNTNPSRGPFHFRAPSKIFWRAVRGMLPHKMSRGQQALDRMRVFEGIPPPFDKLKRVVVPSALRVLRLNPRRKYCELTRLSSEVGWKYAKVIDALEAKRKVKSKRRWTRKRSAEALRTKTHKEVAAKLERFDKVIKQFGHS